MSCCFSNRGGSFTGASYTDVNAVLPAKIILMVIAAICAVGFIVGAFLRSVKLPAVALALLVLSSVLIGGVWPLVLQQVVVSPNGQSKEPPYIQRNLTATRAAYDLGTNKVKYTAYSDATTTKPDALISGNATVDNARLLDPNILSTTFTQKEQLKNFYGFVDPLAIDRYTENGVTQDYVLAVRELSSTNLGGQQSSWIQKHFVYTHGDGLVAAPANQVNADDGYPTFTVSDLSGQGSIPVSEPRVYYGQLATDYAIVGAAAGATPSEYDTDTTTYTYKGTGGVPIGNLFDRLVFATHYTDGNFLFSSEINGNSRIMYNRDPLERVNKVAPFLTTDSNPYPAVVDGKIVWIVDGYTTAVNYPYSQNVSLSNSTQNSQTGTDNGATPPDTNVSYIRNSVKATVDAYTGKVTLYAVDETDPVLKAWEGVFPGLIQPKSTIPAELQAHFRYPQDLFEVQRSLITKYHVSSPVDFYNNSNFWQVPSDPTESGGLNQPPYYQQLELPGATKTTFSLTSALTVFQREYMTAYISASSDPATYGQITVLQLPQNTQTPGPVLIQQVFNSNQAISHYLATLTNNNDKSVAVDGNLLTLPISNGLLYIEPLYVKGVSASASPQLAQIFVWYSGHVGLGVSLDQALANAAATAAVTVPDATNGSGGSSTSGAVVSSAQPSVVSPSSPSTPVVLPSDQAQAIKQMDAANKLLATAKASGDLGKIGTASQALEDAVNNYLKLAGPALTATAVAPSPTKAGG